MVGHRTYWGLRDDGHALTAEQTFHVFILGIQGSNSTLLFGFLSVLASTILLFRSSSRLGRLGNLDGVSAGALREKRAASTAVARGSIGRRDAHLEHGRQIRQREQRLLRRTGRPRCRHASGALRATGE